MWPYRIARVMCFLAAVLISGFMSPSYGEWLEDGAPVCAFPDSQYYPEIVSDGAGGAIIAWTNGHYGALDDHYAQRIDSEGDSLWQTGGFALAPPGSLGWWWSPCASDGAGGAVVVWDEYRDGERDLFAQRIDASGDTLWGPEGVRVCTEDSAQTSARVIADGAGGVMISWIDDRNGSLEDDIYAQRIDASGDTLWGHNGVPVCTAAGQQASHQMISDGAGGAIIVWLDTRESGYSGDIYAQRVDSSGNRLWTPDGVPILAIPSTTMSPSYIGVAPDGAGGAIIVWEDDRTGLLDFKVYAQRVDASGVTQWTANGVALCTSIDRQDNPRAGSDGAGGAIVAWEDDRSDSGDIYAQRIDGSGVLHWGSGGVPLCTTTDRQYNPQCVSDGAGGVVVIWQDNRHGITNIYTQRVDGSGAAQWAADGVALCNTLVDHLSKPCVVTDGAGGSIVAWMDHRGSSWDIYAQRVYGNGTVEGQPEVDVLSPNGGEALEVCSTQNITWTATDGSGVDSVSIFYSVNGGDDYVLIASGEPNDGTYAWAVPGVPTDSAMVRVVAYDAFQNTGEDVSDGVFTIELPAMADWLADGDQASAGFGYSVSGAGDVNGDGYDDVIIGARLYDKGSLDEGMAFVYHGGISGLSGTPDWMGEGEDDQVQYGYSVSDAGDVNNDGYDDVIVGAPFYESSSPQADEGWAFVYHGGPTGLSLTSDWIAESDDNNSNFGNSVSSAGDVNGDGYDDVIIGAYSQSLGQLDEGLAYVYHGSASGLSATPDWTGEEDDDGAEYGYSVSGAGDVNGDGYDDVIVGARYYGSGRKGAAFVYHGSAVGLSATAAWSVQGVEDNDYLGWSVSGAGDVNGDGYDDVIVGAPYGGGASVYHGSASGLSLSPDWNVEDGQSGSYDGMSVAGLGDVNGDGYDDVIVGAPWYDNGEQNEGVAFVYLGSSSGLYESPEWVGEGNQEDAHFGLCVAGAGIINNWPSRCAIVGAEDYDSCLQDEGCAFVYMRPYGTVDVPEGPGRTHPNVLLQNYPNPFRAISGTHISYTAEKAGRVEMRIFDSAGRLIRFMVDRAGAGENRIFWDGRTGDGLRVPSGVYFYEVVMNGFRSHKKMILVE